MKFQKRLVNWFHKNARPLPWRRLCRPYEVWVSETMLQQTQMETALPYFDRWMKTFPTIQSLARSDEKKVLKAWEGLGYYSRARNLHESAKTLVKKHSGKFPERYEDIRSLKGVGRYTAGAIASIAFNEARPIVDGNILRVLSRVYAISKPIDVEKNKETFWKLQESLIPKGQARFFNQALMELGALVCAKDNPLCPSCPIREFCAAYRQNKVGDYPVRNKRPRITKVNASALILEYDGKYLLRRRPLGQLMGGLWEFPEWKLTTTDGIQRKTARLAEKEFGMRFDRLEPVGIIKRNYTRYLENLYVFRTAISNRNFTSGGEWPSAWASKSHFEKYPFSSAHAKIAALIK